MSSCIDRIFTRNESDGSGKTTLEKGGRNPPRVSLLYIIMDLLSFLSQFVSFDRVENQIEEKYNIEKEPGYCWPADDIKRAWGKTQRMAEGSHRRRDWARMILLQAIKRRLDEECKRKEAQSDPASTDDQACGSEPSITEDTEVRSTEWMTRPSRSQKKKKTTKNNQQVKTEDKEDPCAYRSNQTKSVSSPPQSQPSNYNESNKLNNTQTTDYIRTPLSYMPSKVSSEEVPNVSSLYKLIAEVPPGSSNDVRTRKSYVVAFNPNTKNAEWVYEILNKMTLQNKCKKDMSMGKNEFKGENYDQGHLAAAANHKWSQEAYNDTFLFSNMTPQLSRLNKGMWSTLEQYCRDLVKDGVHNVHVYTGPLYLKKEKGSKKYVRVTKPKNEKNFEGKALPTHFFKVVIVEKENGNILEPECYLMPNQEKEYKKQLEQNEEEEEEEEEEEADEEEVVKEKEKAGEVKEEKADEVKEEKADEVKEEEKADEEKEEEKAGEEKEKEKAEAEKEKEKEKAEAEKEKEKEKAEAEKEKEKEKAEAEKEKAEAEKEKEKEKAEAEKEKAEAEKEKEEAEKAKIDKLPIFRTNIKNIENLSGLKFSSKCNPKMKDKKMSVKLMGEKSNGEMHCFDIEVRIIPPKK